MFTNICDDSRRKIKSGGNAVGVKRSNSGVFQSLFEYRSCLGNRQARRPTQTADYAVAAPYAIKSAESVMNLSRCELYSYGTPVHFSQCRDANTSPITSASILV